MSAEWTALPNTQYENYQVKKQEKNGDKRIL